MSWKFSSASYVDELFATSLECLNYFNDDTKYVIIF